ncbi:TorD/DmsD family molecular chaperone [Halanaeroarchaeum sulfurireducens]|uniref:Anaerobic dehydrogenase subunit n=1 Tax=Halanaeroarchaeum sulfurireducens TaxID=1604004 RepID=A0A0F7PAC1_9EURY|nr:molecular chaperone TorD family protein [Halanaeroarchaeum sulfurireducens]AKH96569.1 anaerobic dehydrogenase subunit [Halanaeroarchaeum sulfurireducens]ALG80971.1 anaerobic dehydrogenase subunit [Halanaeroarchaeum sulfurireducens]
MNRESTADDAVPVTDAQVTDWESGLVLLSNCLRQPDDEIRRAIEDGAIREAIDEYFDLPEGLEDSLAVDGRNLTEDYEALFGAFATPFAPPAESPYKPWYGDRAGLMEGPPAADMERRYDALGAEFGESYPADHVALLLEYASLLLEAGDDGTFAAFLSEHLDWIDAFGRMVEEARAEAPFYRSCVDVLVTVVEALRAEWEVADPSEEDIASMVRNAKTNIE